MITIELKKKTDKSYNLDLHEDKFCAGICSKAINLFNYNNESLENIRRYEKTLISTVTGLPENHIYFLNQEHKDKIVSITNRDASLVYEDSADAMITDKKSRCLVIRTADCVPVIIIDNKNNVIGAVHSGWRGTELEIAKKTVEKMITEYKSDISDLKVYILPSITKKSYEVNLEVAEKFPGNFIKKGKKYYLDLTGSIVNSLTNLGLNSNNIFHTNKCTFISNNNFFSHRKGDTGRNLNYIFIK